MPKKSLNKRIKEYIINDLATDEADADMLKKDEKLLDQRIEDFLGNIDAKKAKDTVELRRSTLIEYYSYLVDKDDTRNDRHRIELIIWYNCYDTSQNMKLFILDTDGIRAYPDFIELIEPMTFPMVDIEKNYRGLADTIIVNPKDLKSEEAKTDPTINHIKTCIDKEIIFTTKKGFKLFAKYFQHYEVDSFDMVPYEPIDENLYSFCNIGNIRMAGIWYTYLYKGKNNAKK